MKVAVDLHIHSALSPCADNDMTPNNIVNMALLKGLDIIAVTDHNSAQNFHAVSKCGTQNGILVVAGMEVETSEEVHLITLFPGLRQALLMQEMVHAALPDLENREDVFGQQAVMDENDNIVCYCKRLLLTATALSMEDVFYAVNNLNGVVIPAHIDRESYSVISNLGLIPEELDIRYLEVSKGCDAEEYRKKNSRLKDYSFIKSSDAHNLGDILERESFIELEEISTECLISALKR